MSVFLNNSLQSGGRTTNEFVLAGTQYDRNQNFSNFLGYDAALDGPNLSGNKGGELTSNGKKALTWDAQGNVVFSGNINVGGSDLKTTLSTMQTQLSKIPAAGPAGPVGIQGPIGLQGAKGDQGIQGLVGAMGAKGDQGIQGLVGPMGLVGAKGDQGIQGLKGDAGGINGNYSGNVNIQGNIDATSYTIAGKPFTSGIQGPMGLQGAKGDSGLMGLQGAKGDSGPMGLQGAKGDSGLMGLQGAKGDSGPMGLVGAKGDQGLQGLQGIQGLQGQVGKDGNSSIYMGVNNPKTVVDTSDSLYLENDPSKLNYTQMHLYYNDPAGANNAYISMNKGGQNDGFNGTDAGLNIWEASSLPIKFGSGGKERMRIKADGNASFQGSIDALNYTIGGKPFTAGLQGPQGIPGQTGPTGPAGALAPLADAPIYFRGPGDKNHGIGWTNNKGIDGPSLWGNVGGGLGTANNRDSITWDANGNLKAQGSVDAAGYTIGGKPFTAGLQGPQGIPGQTGPAGPAGPAGALAPLADAPIYFRGPGDKNHGIGYTNNKGIDGPSLWGNVGGGLGTAYNRDSITWDANGNLKAQGNVDAAGYTIGGKPFTGLQGLTGPAGPAGSIGPAGPAGGPGPLGALAPLADAPLYFRGPGDKNHGIGWTNNKNIDGPSLWGNVGGGLGTANNRDSITWDAKGTLSAPKVNSNNYGVGDTNLSQADDWIRLLQNPADVNSYNKGLAAKNLWARDSLFATNVNVGNAVYTDVICNKANTDCFNVADIIRNNSNITLRSNKPGVPELRAQRGDDNLLRFANDNAGTWETMAIEKR
jgi:hypothetical protein